MKKIKYSIIKYFFFTVGISFGCGYLLNEMCPKAYQTAKEEISCIAVNPINKLDIITVNEKKKDSSIIEIPIKIIDNLIYLNAKVNTVDMLFLLDTGCSTVQITSAEYYYMVHRRLISDVDLKDSVICEYADGSNKECLTLNIDSIDIGGIKVKNITASIEENCNTDLLLGQEVLKQCGEFSIDYDNKLLKIKKK